MIDRYWLWYHVGEVNIDASLFFIMQTLFICETSDVSVNGDDKIGIIIVCMRNSSNILFFSFFFDSNLRSISFRIWVYSALRFCCCFSSPCFNLKKDFSGQCWPSWSFSSISSFVRSLYTNDWRILRLLTLKPTKSLSSLKRILKPYKKLCLRKREKIDVIAPKRDVTFWCLFDYEKKTWIYMNSVLELAPFTTACITGIGPLLQNVH